MTFICVIFIACNNSKYGCIEGDCLNGAGTIQYTNGGIEKGDFVNGKLNGYGMIIWGKGECEGDTLKGYFENGIIKGEAKLYKAAFDATFVGLIKNNSDFSFDLKPTNGQFKVYFGENSLWEGTFVGEFVNGTCKEWEERINIKHTKNGKFAAKNAGLFRSAIFCYSQEKAIQKCLEPLSKVYKKDLAKDNISLKEIQEVIDSLQSLRNILTNSLSKLKQLEEFDKNIPLKDNLFKYYTQFSISIDKNLPRILMLFIQPPSKQKQQDIFSFNRAFELDFKNFGIAFSMTSNDFENKHIKFHEE